MRICTVSAVQIPLNTRVQNGPDLLLKLLFEADLAVLIFIYTS